MRMAICFSNIIDIRRRNGYDRLPKANLNHKRMTIGYSSGFVFYERSITLGITNVNQLIFMLGYKSNIE